MFSMFCLAHSQMQSHPCHGVDACSRVRPSDSQGSTPTTSSSITISSLPTSLSHHLRHISYVECSTMSPAPSKDIEPSIPETSSAAESKNVSLEDRTLFLLAGLMEGGQEDEDTCKQLDTLTKLLNDDSSDETRATEPHKPLYELIDTDSVETILGYLDMRQEAVVRGHATLTTSAYLKAAANTGVESLSEFFYNRVGKGTYDDLIVAFSVAASLFPIVPDVIATLFLSEGFVASLGPLMKRKWKSKKVEKASLEMLNAACMNASCREVVKKYCTEWLDEIVNDVPPFHADVSSPDRQEVIEDGSVQQRIHSEQVRNLAAVVLTKLQVG
jgi:hypothetical protein